MEADSTSDEEDLQEEEEEEGDLCSNATSKIPVKQYRFQCKSCEVVAICSHCASACHRNHPVSFLHYGSFACSCGTTFKTTCKRLSSSHKKTDILNGILRALNSQRHEGILCDVTFKVEEQLFPAHRALLSSQSPYFQGMFTGTMVESTQEVIEIKEIEWQDFKLILEYMYGHHFKVDEENIGNVMLISDRFCVDSLFQECKDFLTNHWMEMEAEEVATLSSSFNVTLVEGMLANVKNFFWGNEEDSEGYLLLNMSYVLYALEDSGAITWPTNALKVLKEWVDYKSDRLPLFVVLLPSYPLDRAPVLAIRVFFGSLGDRYSRYKNELTNILQESRRKHVQDSQIIKLVIDFSVAVKVFQFRYGLCHIFISLYRRDACPVEQFIFAHKRMYMFTPTKMYLLNLETKSLILTRDIPRNCPDAHFAVTAEGILMTYSKHGNSVIKMVKHSHKHNWVSMNSVISNTLCPSLFVDGSKVYIIGGERGSDSTEDTLSEACQSCQIYDATLDELFLINLLHTPTCRPLVCSYKSNLLILDRDLQPSSDCLVAHLLNTTTTDIFAFPLDIRTLKNCQAFYGWTVFDLHDAVITDRNGTTLLLVFIIGDQDNHEILIASSDVKETSSRLEFSPIATQIFFAIPKGDKDKCNHFVSIVNIDK